MLNRDRTEADLNQLRQLYALLDEALDLSATERGAWLERLGEVHQPLQPRLRALLAQASVETDDFLQRPARVPALDSMGLSPDCAGDRVGPYRLIEEIGSGGMATVWLAERDDGALKRQVALKLPHTGWNPGLLQRMARERDMLAALEHPHIARLYDAGLTAEGRPWLAMEVVQGQPIDAWCRDRNPTVPQVLRLALQVCDALAHAHARLIVHRDLKPANILVTEAGQVRLVDFGVGKLLQDDAKNETQLTRVHGNAMTPDYASPEQVARRPLTVATDVYSLGVVLYELLTGERPYKLGWLGAAALEEAILAADVPLASTRVGSERDLARQLRGDLDIILAKALRKSPAQRYASVEQMAADVQRHLAGEPVLARPRSRRYRLAKFMTRHRGAATAAAAVMLALLGGTVASLRQADEAHRQAALANSRLLQAEASLDFATRVLGEGLRADETISLAALVDRSAALAEATQLGDPIARASAAGLVASMYINFGRHAQADAVLTRVLEGLPADVAPSVRYPLVCRRAGLGLRKNAVRELDDAIAATESDPATQAYCLVRRSVQARTLNDAQAALSYIRRALAVYRSTGMSSPGNLANMLADLAYALRLNGLADESDQAYQSATALLTTAGRSESAVMPTVLAGWASTLASTGEPAAALAKAEAAVALARRTSPDGQVSPYLLLERANNLRLLGRFDLALQDYELALAAAQSTGNVGMQLFTHAARAQTLVRAGRVAEAESELAFGAALMSQHPEQLAGSPKQNMLLAQGVVHLARARLDEADQPLSEFIEQFSAAGSRNRSLATAQLMRAEVALAASRLPQAASLAQSALDVAARMQGGRQHSDLTGLAQLMLARVHLAAGRIEQARQACAGAQVQLRATVDSSHPQRVQAEQMAAELGL